MQTNYTSTPTTTATTPLRPLYRDHYLAIALDRCLEKSQEVADALAIYLKENGHTDLHTFIEDAYYLECRLQEVEAELEEATSRQYVVVLPHKRQIATFTKREDALHSLLYIQQQRFPSLFTLPDEFSKADEQHTWQYLEEIRLVSLDKSIPAPFLMPLDIYLERTVENYHDETAE